MAAARVAAMDQRRSAAECGLPNLWQLDLAAWHSGSGGMRRRLSGLGVISGLSSSGSSSGKKGGRQASRRPVALHGCSQQPPLCCTAPAAAAAHLLLPRALPAAPPPPQIFERNPTTVKNYGIWVRYQSRTGYHNAYKVRRRPGDGWQAGRGGRQAALVPAPCGGARPGPRLCLAGP